MKKLTDLKVYLCIVLVSLLCSCTSTANKVTPGSTAHSRVKAINEASRYQQLAGKEHTDSAMNYRLRAAEQLALAGEYDQAVKMMDQNNKRRLNPENSVYKQLILAQIAVDKNQPEAAQAHLSTVWTPLQLPEYLKLRFYTLRSNAFLLAGNNTDAIQERVFLSKHLKSQVDQSTNNAAIWEILTQFSPHALQTMQKPNTKDAYNGWITFALISKQNDIDATERNVALSVWKENYPDHPAIAFMQIPEAQPIQAQEPVKQRPAFINKAKPYDGKAIDVPRKIALLLPMQGSHAQAAQAVRDGFLAAHEAQSSSANKPKVELYNTAEYDDIEAAYRAAVNEGAEFIVGPLIKEDVETLHNSIRPSVPVLALNVTSQDRTKDNVFQFGLSPEMEATAVADRAWRDGHRKALVIAPKSAWGQRMTSAFIKRWEELGGMVLASQQVASQSNVNKEVQAMLAIDASEARAKQLKSLGLKFSFTTHRRQDPDMIFIATNAALARQVKPLLNFYYAARLPAYASSSVFSGKSQPGLDQDLNGVKFCDMPWILDYSVRATAAYRASANSNLSSEQTARLYALGLDAYKVAVQIDQLTMLPELGLSGMTGTLTLDQQQNVQRKLMWAAFRKGTPHIEGEQY